MTDLHTHILPGVDDGAQTVEEAISMLQMQAAQGVNTVALTPHFHGRKESAEEFLLRREEAWKRLVEATKEQPGPELILGAEVSWMPDMSKWPELESLCYQGTKTLLVELPVRPWTDTVYQELNRLEGRRGIMPMIAHVDRYFYCQKKSDIVRLLDMGYPVQVSADALFSVFHRKQAVEFLDRYDGLLISDCHNCEDRSPDLEKAYKIVKKKLGLNAVQRIADLTDEILID